MSLLPETISSLLPELVMFGLAAVMYVFLASYAPRVPRSQDHRKIKEKTPTDSASSGDEATAISEAKPKPRRQEPELPLAYLPVVQAAKCGDAAGAVNALSALSPDEQAAFPLEAASKVLLTLAKTSNIPEELMYKFIDLSSIFDEKVFEKAAVLSSRWGSVTTCQQLYNLAGLASVRKSTKLLSYVLAGLLHDDEAALAFIQVITSSGAHLTQQAFQLLALQCTEAGLHDGATMLKQTRVKRREPKPEKQTCKVAENSSLEGLLLPHLKKIKEKYRAEQASNERTAVL
eukprot:TRINITY_DN110664_c0_g1_i1.p1 TRINITY_DN110664_c0_g1~~TRINITY_DN110664_c0_g1_i1.p1  ORF type:complete len:289 (+),score=75.38 TRINITY_DN110664_c0_g1_i1:190-1056(+)